MKAKTLILISTICFVFVSQALADGPRVQSGDLVFQTSKSDQSYAIMWASKSVYSHVGIVEVDGDKKYVIEAIKTVSRTPFDQWVKRGRLKRYAVFRYAGLNPENQKKVAATSAL